MLSVKTDYLFILHWFLLPQKPYVLYWQGDCYVLVADVVPAGIAPQDFHLGDGVGAPRGYQVGFELYLARLHPRVVVSLGDLDRRMSEQRCDALDLYAVE